MDVFFNVGAYKCSDTQFSLKRGQDIAIDCKELYIVQDKGFYI